MSSSSSGCIPRLKVDGASYRDNGRVPPENKGRAVIVIVIA